MNMYGPLVGRLGTDPEKIGSTGARFRLSSSDRVKNEQGQWEDRDQTWTTVKVWGKNAEYVLSTLKKGQEVIVVGTIAEESWTDKEGNKRSSYELKADHIGATVFTLAKKPAVTIKTTAEDPWVKAPF
jgi:single-strand DNA-binding protein